MNQRLMARFVDFPFSKFWGIHVNGPNCMRSAPAVETHHDFAALPGALSNLDRGAVVHDPEVALGSDAPCCRHLHPVTTWCTSSFDGVWLFLYLCFEIKQTTATPWANRISSRTLSCFVVVVVVFCCCCCCFFKSLHNFVNPRVWILSLCKVTNPYIQVGDAPWEGRGELVNTLYSLIL